MYFENWTGGPSENLLGLEVSDAAGRGSAGGVGSIGRQGHDQRDQPQR